MPPTNTVILHSHGDAIFTLELNNPDKRNALTPEMWRVMIAHLESLARADCRAIIVSGHGDHFCSGADIGNLDPSRDEQSQLDLTTEGLRLLRHIRVPTIAAIRGSCVGGGLALALACDFQIADSSARLGVPSAQLGLVFSVHQTRILVSQIGLTNTRKLLLLAQTVKPEEARTMNLISEICDTAVHERALEIARSLLINAPLSLEGSKKVILNAVEAIIERQIAPGVEEIVKAARKSQDHAEAKRAFLEKRKPIFVGK